MTVDDKWLHAPHPLRVLGPGGCWADVTQSPGGVVSLSVCGRSGYMSRPPLTPQTWPVM
jgi:hypothetical protein